LQLEASPRQIVREILSQKYSTLKRAGRIGQVVEHLPSNHEGLDSKPVLPEKKREYKELP
jgi:hypothetical protein